MHRIPRFFTRSENRKGMDSKQKQKVRKLERRNAVKNFDYEPSASSSSSSEESFSLRTRSLDAVPFCDRTSFRLEGYEGEIDMICQNLGLSPEDFVIPAEEWMGRKIRSSSDILPRSRLSQLGSPRVDDPPSEVDDVVASELSTDFANIAKVGDVTEGQTEPAESKGCELSCRLDYSRARDSSDSIYSSKNQNGLAEPFQWSNNIHSSAVGGRGGGIRGVRPPVLAPPPAISLPAFDNSCSTWDLLKSFAPEGDVGSSFAINEGFTTSDNDVDEEIVMRDEANGARLGETTVLSASCSFTTSSNDDDSSSTTTDPAYNISPNFKFRRTITSWQKGELLGRGSFGAVYEGISDDGFFFALKEVSLLDQGVQGRQSIFQLEQEIALLSQFEHENIVQYYGTSKDESTLYIFLELVTKGSLLSLYQKYNLRDSQVSAYTRQILYGLKYLHDQDVVHRDIKCANILVDVNGSVKLADFGLAKLTKLNDVKSCKGTPCWMAPEVVRSRGYGLAADIWSLGCTVLEMLTRQIPYSNLECQMQAIYRIGKGELPCVPDSLSEDSRDFILKCLQTDPRARPTATELLDHPFVKRLLPTSSGSASPHTRGGLF